MNDKNAEKAKRTKATCAEATCAAAKCAKASTVAALVSLLLLSSSAATLPTLAPDGAAAITALLHKTTESGAIPAVAAVVANQERVLLLDAAGIRDEARHASVAPDSIFRIASMTKPVTSLVVMMLSEEGKIGIEDPVTKYLPEFERVRVLTAFRDADRSFDARPPARPITIRHLLTHTSGIGYSFGDPRLAKLDDGKKTEVDLPLLHDPGEHFTYGPNTAVLGRVIEKVTGQKLDAVMKTRVFDPLGMRDTFYAVPADRIDRVVTVRRRSGNGWTEMPNPTPLQSTVRGDGGLFSTAADYATFMQVFLNGGRAGTTRLAREETIRQMMSNQMGRVLVAEQPSSNSMVAKPFPFGGGKDAFGFGFQIENAPAASGLRSVGSASWGGINNTHFWIDPQKHIAAAVLMQVLPYYDPSALETLRGVERLVYQHVK
jgi:methyl acetate hydrolase